MMRFVPVTLLVSLVLSLPVRGQQRNPPTQQRPFPPLTSAQHAQLAEFLKAWERQSKSTKTLDCKFKRWHYDVNGAAAGVHTTKAEGVIRYANPDKGLFRVDHLVFFQGMRDGKPEYKAIEGRFGEHWVCNGKQLIEMDRSNKKCEIQELPPEMQGQQIFNSPLPFVFNLDAQQILSRYWVRLRDQPDRSIVLVEAFPKRQEDRAQYKLVQIALDAQTYLPRALVMYAPNFDAKTAPNLDQYEFENVKRNNLTAGFQQFIRNFIPEKPPKDWQIVRNKFSPMAPPAQQPPIAQGQPAAKRAELPQRGQPGAGAPGAGTPGAGALGDRQRADSLAPARRFD